MENIISDIVLFFQDKVPKELIVFIISMIPILELRGSLIAAGFLKMEFLTTYLIAVVGNFLPIPFILIFIRKIFLMLKKTKMRKFIQKLEDRALNKREVIDKYGFWGLCIFVAIPLPGTGGWTGALLASLLNMKPRKASLYILFGIMIAGLIMSLISFGLIKNII